MIIRYLDNRKKIMVALETPICDFGWKAPEFNLIGIDNKYYSFQDIKGPNGTLVMFICNHCPYVKSVIHRIVEDTTILKEKGIGVIAIMSNDVNDPKYGEEDSFDNMKLFSDKNNFVFPYVYDETQNVGRKYNAVCTPDFFGFNRDLELQYRGRMRELKDLKPVRSGDSELFLAMKKIAETGIGPVDQIPSMGCNIKWK